MNYFTISPYLYKTIKIQSMFPHLTLHIEVELQGSSGQWTEKDVKGGGHDFIECIALEFARRERLTAVRLFGYMLKFETCIFPIQTTSIITGGNCRSP
jgi:hypothetical protein